jgi:hypothetical protein
MLRTFIKWKKRQPLFLVVLLFSFIILFTGCARQIGNAVKVDDPTGSKTEPIIKNKSSGVLLGIKSKKRGSKENSFSAGIKTMELKGGIQYKTLYITNNKGKSRIKCTRFRCFSAQE